MTQTRKIAGVVIQPKLHDPETIDRIRRRAVYRKNVPIGQYQRDVLTLMEQIAAREAQLTGVFASPIAPPVPPEALPVAQAPSALALDAPAAAPTPGPRVTDPTEAADRLGSILGALDHLQGPTKGGMTA